MDGGREGRPGDAKEDVHPPRLTDVGGTVDAESRVFPQTEAHQQHIRQAWIRKSALSIDIYMKIDNL